VEPKDRVNPIVRRGDEGARPEILRARSERTPRSPSSDPNGHPLAEGNCCRGRKRQRKAKATKKEPGGEEMVTMFRCCGSCHLVCAWATRTRQGGAALSSRTGTTPTVHGGLPVGLNFSAASFPCRTDGSRQKRRRAWTTGFCPRARSTS
jgi:hypothetical protein